MAAMKRATCARLKNQLRAALRRPRNCSNASMASGAVRSIRSSRNTRTDRPQLLSRLCCIRQVVERRDNVLGKCVGKRRALMGVAYKTDATARQVGETIRCRQNAHAGTKARLRKH